MANIKIVVIESPNPIDLFKGRTESEGLVSSCKLIGHQAISFFVKSRRDFKEICQYLASSNTEHDSEHSSAPLFLHISCHGNSTGIAFGTDNLNWEDLVSDIEPILNNPLYEGNFALVISSCGSGEHDLHKHFLKKINEDDSLKIPKYIFSIPGDTISWDDALVGWIVFYHKLSNIKLENRKRVQAALKGIFSGTEIKFLYHRWIDEENKYKTFTPESPG